METHGQAVNTLQNTKQYPRVGQNWSYNAWSAPISITRRYFDLMKGWYGEVRNSHRQLNELMIAIDY